MRIDAITLPTVVEQSSAVTIDLRSFERNKIRILWEGQESQGDYILVSKYVSTK